MYEFLGRKLNISDEKLKEYEHFMYGPLTDTEIKYYIDLTYHFNVDEEPDKLTVISDNELSSVIVSLMEDEMDVMRPVGK